MCLRAGFAHALSLSNLSLTLTRFRVNVKLKPGHALTEEQMQGFCEGLPRYKRPRRYIFEDVPRNPTGKIEKPKLRERYGVDRLVEKEITH